MNAERIITEPALAKLWRVDPLRPSRWRHEDLLSSDIQERIRGGNRSHFYYLHSIDRLHQQAGVNFGDDVPPTTAELLAAPAGGHSLLTTEEVAELFGIGPTGVLSQVERGVLPVIKLPGGTTFRYPASTVHALMLAENGEAVNITMACRMLCMSRIRVEDLGRSGRLKTVKVLGQGNRFFVTRESLLKVLGELLHNITPEEWWQRRMDSDVITPFEVRMKYHISQPRWYELVEKHAVPYITTPTGRYWHIPVWAIDGVASDRVPLPLREIHKIFPVDDGQLAKWTACYKLCGSDHKHLKLTCTSMGCLRGYIDEHASIPALTSGEWLTHCLQDGVEPMTVDELVGSTVGTDNESVLAALRAGEMRGVYLPPIRGEEQALILRADAIAWRRTVERRLRREYE